MQNVIYNVDKCSLQGKATIEPFKTSLANRGQNAEAKTNIEVLHQSFSFSEDKVIVIQGE